MMTDEKRLLELCRNVSKETDSAKITELIRKLNEELDDPSNKMDTELVPKNQDKLPRAS